MGSASRNLYVDVLTFQKKEKSQEDIIIIIMATQVVKGYFRVAVCATVLAAVYGFPGPQGPEGPLAIPREEIAVAASGSPASALRFETGSLSPVRQPPSPPQQQVSSFQDTLFFQNHGLVPVKYKSGS